MVNAATIWWHRNRNIIFMIPAFIAIVAIILESSQLPAAYQSIAIVAGVLAAFGIPAGIVAYSTITGWAGSWFVLEFAHSLEDVYLNYINSPIAEEEEISPGRWERTIHLAATVNLEEFFPGTGDSMQIKIRSDGHLHQRVHGRYGLIFNDGMPVINSNVERLVVYPLPAEATREEGAFLSTPTFELVLARNGDYARYTDPAIMTVFWAASQVPAIAQVALRSWARHLAGDREDNVTVQVLEGGDEAQEGGEDERSEALERAGTEEEAMRASAASAAAPERKTVDLAGAVEIDVDELTAPERVDSSFREEAPKPSPETVTALARGTGAIKKAPPSLEVTAYCVREKLKGAKMVDVEEVTLANGAKALKGKCSTCGSTLFKITGGPKKKGGAAQV
jgi:Domain of unknown function (DUF5679)